MDVKVASLNSATFKKDMLDSILNTGFVVITDHGIDESLIRSNQQGWKTFFESSLDVKNSFINEKDGNLGYKGMKSERAVGASVADLKEFYHWKIGEKLPSYLINDTIKMFLRLSAVGAEILCAIDQVDPGTSYEEDCSFSEQTIMRSLYYPALSSVEVEPGAVRAAAHEDINAITLLVAASAPGLQVLDKNGRWHDVPHEQNSITVNIGDMLQMASGGKYKSTTHRVVNPSNSHEPRISMPLFISFRPSTELQPGFTAAQYLAQRISEIYQANK